MSHAQLEALANLWFAWGNPLIARAMRAAQLDWLEQEVSGKLSRVGLDWEIFWKKIQVHCGRKRQNIVRWFNPRGKGPTFRPQQPGDGLMLATATALNIEVQGLVPVNVYWVSRAAYYLCVKIFQQGKCFTLEEAETYAAFLLARPPLPEPVPRSDLEGRLDRLPFERRLTIDKVARVLGAILLRLNPDDPANGQSIEDLQ